MTVVKIKKQIVQKSMSQKENLNWKITKTVQKQLNLIVKINNLKKMKLVQIFLKKS